MRYRDLVESDSIILYHGTHKRHLKNILAHGIKASETNLRQPVCATPRADVAFGYGCMSGEGNWDGKSVPAEDRLVVKMKVPAQWYKEHFLSKDSDYAPEIVFDASIPSEFIVDYNIGALNGFE